MNFQMKHFTKKVELRNNPETVIRYHEETKHHFHRYARSLGYLDWANQPNPFRFYEGVNPVRFPFAKNDPDAAYMDLYERTRNQTKDFSFENLSLFLELSLGVSAWKSIPGAKWALRINPSSGNLHPTESYVVLFSKNNSDPGIFHYSPFLHVLEPRANLPDELCQRLRAHFHTDGFLFALTSIYWREAWKYGERAFRYCNHDIGHAIASASFAANLFGWKICYLNEVSDDTITRILGFHKTSWAAQEEEHPEILCFIHPYKAKETPKNLSSIIIDEISGLPFLGQPNQLSDAHVDWEIISEVSRETVNPGMKSDDNIYTQRPFLNSPESILSAAQIIRQRRSAVAFDGMTSISKEEFFTMIDRTLPRKDCVPFDFGLGPVRVHLLLFVHRVRGLESGLYMFCRQDEHLEELKSACLPQFRWQQVERDFPLYLLEEGPLMHEAVSVSCSQAIAGDSAFSVGMIAKFQESVLEAPHLYRHLFWETGMIGQVLYLGAEAHGVRSTGIGCFLDDSVHEIMGLRDNQFQSLYHFTVGGPVEDDRLQTLPPYFHLNGQSDKNT